ncbi:MAG: FHA domain-containing protein [Wenzhouxiangellaceae bacterium]
MTKYRLKSASGPLTGQTFGLGESTLIGSSEGADVRLDGLEAEHAKIVRRDGGLVLEAAGEVRVNGETVGTAALQSGDEIQFGTFRFVLQAPGLKPVRVLDQVPESRASGWKWLAAAGVAAAAAAAGWWLWLGPGMGS